MNQEKKGKKRLLIKRPKGYTYYTKKLKQDKPELSKDI